MRVSRRSLLARSVGLAAIACALSAPGCTKSEPDRFATLNAAVAGTPDEATVSAMKVLIPVLTVEEWVYLSHAKWPDDDGSAALRDPVLRKAVDALISAMLTSSSTASADIKLQSIFSQQGQFIKAINLAQWKQTYPDALPLLPSSKGTDNYSANAAVATAWSLLLYGTIAAPPTPTPTVQPAVSDSPLPTPMVAADLNLANCGKEFYDGTGPVSASCSIADFCCKGEVDFTIGKTTCIDFASCRAKPPPPKLQGSGGSSGSGGSMCGSRYDVLDPGTGGAGACPGPSCNGSGSVRDTTTGLTWLRFPYFKNSAQNLADVIASCGDKGMRLPTKDEVLAIAGANFDSCAWPAPWYTWTSTSPASNQYWYVGSGGDAMIKGIELLDNRVLCVH